MVTFLTTAPLLPSGDMAKTLRHYARLGFAVRDHGGSYGTATRDGFNLHFALDPDHRPDTGGGGVYIGVDDATALHAEWVAAGVGETGDLHDPGFGVWEAAHTDGDGNIIRFGSLAGTGPRP
jgi:glyoxalase/bleomycin resistance protein/dioxygenase superfamily protein